MFFTHDKLIKSYCEEYPFFKTRGFKKKVRSLIEKKDDWCEEEMSDQFRDCCALVPDMFYITDDEISVIEVEVSNPLSMFKFKKYLWLWFLCDYCRIDLRLFIMDRFSNVNEIPMSKFYLMEARESADKIKQRTTEGANA